ncbi:MAG: glycosyltransferase family 4 protein [Bacteroidota bacterium]
MHLALFTDGVYPYVVGGIQKHAQTLAIEWASRGYRVSLFHPGSGQKRAETEPLAGFSTEIWPNIQEIIVPFPAPGRLPGHYIRENRAYARALLAHLEQMADRPDFVYAQALTGWALAEARHKGQMDLPPVCASPHGLEMFQLTADWKSRIGLSLLRTPMRSVLRQADYVHSLGGKLTDILREQGIRDQQIWEVSGGIPRDWMRTDVPPMPGKRQHWVFIGRYERRKGIQELHAVLPELLAAYPVDMTFIGPIPEEVRLQHAQVRYMGLVQDSQLIRSTLDHADVLLCPSYAEGMPIVIMEAMARGLAVVATDVGATRALVPDEVGWCIPPAQISLLRRVLHEVASTPSSALHNKKKAALAHIQPFSWELINDQLLEKIHQSISLSTLA